MYSDDRSNLVIVGETAFNHEGDFQYLLRLVDMVASAGATHVKFQVLIDYDEFVSQKSEAYDLVKSWCFNKEQWEVAFCYAESLGLRLFVMPLDTLAVPLCQRNTVDYVEIHSVSFNDVFLLSAVNSSLSDKTIGLGIGGRNLDELKALESKLRQHKLLLLCGFQAFPSELEEVKLARIKYLQNHFPNAIMGYADHSSPESLDSVYSSHCAYQLGARVFEKHVTLELDRTDSQSALMGVAFNNYIEQLHRYVAVIEESEEAAFCMTSNEQVYRERQKKAVAILPISQGDVFTVENIALKMHTDKGTFPYLEVLLDTPAKQNYLVGEVIC